MQVPHWPSVRVPQPLGLYARDLLHRSVEFGEAFDALELKPSSNFHYPAYYVLSHGTELALKAFLAATGVNKRGLKKLDHDLTRIAKAAKLAGMPDVDMFDHLIRRLTGLNQEQSLRYPAWEFRDFPAPEECSKVLVATQNAVRPVVNSAALQGRFQLWERFAPPAHYVWED